jgi:hypothetical protein
METAATPRQTAWHEAGHAVVAWERALPSPEYLSGRMAAALDAHNMLPQATALFLQSGSAKTSSLWLDGRLNSRLERPTRMATGRCAPQGRNCGILRQTRWDGSMKRQTLEWHLLLVLSVLVSSPGATTAQNGLASPPLRRCSPAPTR